jgi:hypothetical protein
VKVEVVSKNVGVMENGAKMWVVWKYSYACLKIKLWMMHLWVGGSCWGRGTKFELAAKAWAYKKNSSYKFSQWPTRKCLS